MFAVSYLYIPCIYIDYYFVKMKEGRVAHSKCCLPYVGVRLTHQQPCQTFRSFFDGIVPLFPSSAAFA